MTGAGLIPRRKDVLGYARALVRCTTRMQLDIVTESYGQHVPDRAHREVLDILANALSKQLALAPAAVVPSNGPDFSEVKDRLTEQLTGLRLMRGAAEKAGFRLRVAQLEIEIER